LDLVETIVIGLSLFLVVYLFLVQPHQVNGQSMLPSFESGEYVLTDKVSYRVGEPKRGDVIVFHAPEPANCTAGTGCDFIKRIIALPGESVEVKSNGLYINDEKLLETYIPDTYETSAGAFTRDRKVVLGPDEYFVVGDNREHSSDSRSWGPIARSNIVGKAFFRYWPAEKIGLIESANY